MSRARNSADGFGWVSRGLHWAMAAAILAMLALGTWLARAEPSLDTLWLFGLHKTVGLSLLVLVLVRLAWHRASPPPPVLSERVPGWQVAAARGVHAGLYLLMLAVPLSGWVASAASGIDTVIFGTVTVPRIVPVSPAIEAAGFAAHGVLTKLLILAVAIHVAGALHRQLVSGDATLRRMMGG